MKGVILLLALSFTTLEFLWSHVTFAASFDCSRASGWVEKKICSNPELSDADETLNLKYREILGKTKDKDNFIKTQRRWLKKRNSVTDEFMLLRIYNDRLIELDLVLIPMQSITSTCPGFIKRNNINDISDCKVSETGLMGSVGGRTYHYSIYCIIPDYVSPPDNKCNSKSAGYHANRGLSIFYKEGTTNKLKLFIDRGTPDVGLYVYDKPEIVTHSFGTVLYVPNRLDGTGHYNESEYYLWDTTIREWKLIDSGSWLKDAVKQLPTGDFGHGIWPDMTTMTANIYLRMKDDPYCCPSGGIASVSLTVKNGKFAITSIKIKKEEEQ